MGEHDGPLDGNAGKVRRLRALADRVHEATKYGERQQASDNQGQERPEDYGSGNDTQLRVVHVVEEAWDISRRLAAREELHQSDEHDTHSKRHDHRRSMPLADHKAVEETDRRTGPQRDGGKKGKRGVREEARRYEVVDEEDDPAARKIDALDPHHDQLPEDQDAKRCVLPDKHAEHVWVQHRGPVDPQRDQKDSEDVVRWRYAQQALDDRVVEYRSHLEPHLLA